MLYIKLTGILEHVKSRAGWGIRYQSLSILIGQVKAYVNKYLTHTRMVEKLLFEMGIHPHFIRYSIFKWIFSLWVFHLTKRFHSTFLQSLPWSCVTFDTFFEVQCKGESKVEPRRNQRDAVLDSIFLKTTTHQNDNITQKCKVFLKWN